MYQPQNQSSSDEDEYIEITDPEILKRLQRKEKIVKNIPRMGENDQNKIASTIIRNDEKFKTSNKYEKNKEENRGSTKKKINNFNQKDSKAKIVYKEKDVDHQATSYSRLKYQPKAQKTKLFKEKPENFIEVHFNDTIEDLVQKIEKKLKTYNFFVLSAVGASSIEKAFLVVEELHQINSKLKRINIPSTVRNDKKIEPKINIEMSLLENQLDKKHMGYQQTTQNQYHNKTLRKSMREKDFDSSRQYR